MNTTPTTPPHPATHPATNHITRMVTDQPDWGADELDHIANLIGTTGRPHPGDYDLDAEAYARDQDAWERDNPAPQGAQALADYYCLNTAARILGEHPEWGADQIGDLANLFHDA